MKTSTITTTMKITEVNLEAVDHMEVKLQDDFSEVKIPMAEANVIKILIRDNTKATIIKAVAIRVIAVNVVTHVEANYQGNNNYQCHQYYSNDNDYQPEQYGPPCALCSGYNHSLKHCFKGEHDINNIMEKTNISGHQSQQSGLYQ